MKISNNTILITGGGSGIGFETTKLFAERGNKVIITGTNETELESTVQRLPNVHYIVADITKKEDVNVLVRKVQQDFPQLNVLVNNSSQAIEHRIDESPSPAGNMLNEMDLAIVHLTTKLLPILKQQPEAAIINVCSISRPTYSASRPSLHLYSQTLRSLASETNVKVFEVMLPLVDRLSKNNQSNKKISSAQVAFEIMQSIEQNRDEVRVTSIEKMYGNLLTKAGMAVLALYGLGLN